MAQLVKNLPADAGDARNVGLIPGLGRSPGEGNGHPLQYSCLENSHGQRSLAGYSPWGRKESGRTKHTRTVRNAHFRSGPCVLRSLILSLPAEPAPGGTGGPEFEITESMP